MLDLYFSKSSTRLGVKIVGPELKKRKKSPPYHTMAERKSFSSISGKKRDKQSQWHSPIITCSRGSKYLGYKPGLWVDFMVPVSVPGYDGDRALLKHKGLMREVL